MSESEKGSGHSTRCPRCGLVLRIMAHADGPELGYDFAAWGRICRSPQLGGPSMCLARACAPGVAPADRRYGSRRDDPAFEPLG